MNMNHIKQLQMDKAALQDQHNAAIEELISFRAHLRSDKFTGVSQDGSRLDWIATKDVDQRLVNLLDILRGLA